jgi:hypothetical protein
MTGFGTFGTKFHDGRDRVGSNMFVDLPGPPSSMSSEPSDERQDFSSLGDDGRFCRLGRDHFRAGGDA